MSEEKPISGSGNRKVRVGVIFGGRSGEHEVSLMSARSVISALDPEKYDVVMIGITKSGRWLHCSRSFRFDSPLSTRTDVIPAR